jgi:predicted nucleic acid-binding protein
LRILSIEDLSAASSVSTSEPASTDPALSLQRFVALWAREAALLPAVLLVQCGTGTLTDATRQAIEKLPAPLIVASRDPLRLERYTLRYTVDKPQPGSQKSLWTSALKSRDVALADGLLDELAEQFHLSAETIATVGASIRASVAASPDAPARIAELVWSTCRSLSRPRLEELAERIVPAAAWEDLILPEPQKQTLHHLAAQARFRMTVYQSWGFAARGRRGLGISALFAGASGTGKTLAAEVLAKELRLDLFRIDLSAVVSKYIGETEKNLKQVFDAAEEGGVLLLFDEADALFGKRAEVKDSHDRYANIEVSYLLQRMESFQGIAILTTNLKSSLDKAFQRRLRFTVDFPFPGPQEREAIWRSVFPAAAPTDGLDLKRLAQLNMTGGNIRNIALNAAFLAAEAGSSIEMRNVLQATRQEAIKAERPLADSEIRGWA